MAAEATNTSSIGLLSTYQKSSEQSTENDFFTSIGNQSNWRSGRTFQSEGTLSAQLVTSDSSTSQELSLNKTLSWQGKDASHSLSLTGTLNESEGLAFLDLNDQFDQAQRLDVINGGQGGDTSIYSQSTQGQYSFSYDLGRYSQLDYSFNGSRELTADGLSDRTAEQRIELQSHGAGLQLGASPYINFALQGTSSTLAIFANTPAIEVDTKQIERIVLAQINWLPTQTLAFAPGFFSQQVELGEEDTTVDGPILGINWQLDRNQNLTSSFGVLSIKFFDDTTSTFESVQLEYSNNLSRIRNLSLSFDKRFETANDIFELLASQPDEFERRGFTSENYGVTLQDTYRNGTTGFTLSHTNLYIEQSQLSFQETLGQWQGLLRSGLRSSLAGNVTLRQQKDFIADDNPQTQIVGVGAGYRYTFNPSLGQRQWGSDINLEQQTDKPSNTVLSRLSITVSGAITF